MTLRIVLVCSIVYITNSSGSVYRYICLYRDMYDFVDDILLFILFCILLITFYVQFLLYYYPPPVVILSISCCSPETGSMRLTSSNSDSRRYTNNTNLGTLRVHSLLVLSSAVLDAVQGAIWLSSQVHQLV